jgi:hypothetical protein
MKRTKSITQQSPLKKQKSLSDTNSGGSDTDGARGMDLRPDSDKTPVKKRKDSIAKKRGGDEDRIRDSDSSPKLKLAKADSKREIEIQIEEPPSSVQRVRADSEIVLESPVNPDGDYDVLESPNAPHVGVQLVLDRDGKVKSVLVAGRPASPFTGTMGDHVTAFGAHVVKLNRTLKGKSLAEAAEAINKRVLQLSALPGYALIETGTSEWRQWRDQLKAELGNLGREKEPLGGKLSLKRSREQPDQQQTDAQLATLQRAAALYLEVREGIPFSLLNTRSITADSGKGRGESRWLPRLAENTGEQQTKRSKLSGGKPGDEEADIALGLFDQDAAALLTFNHLTKQRDLVAQLLPSHTDVDAVMKLSPKELAENVARQHVQSLFPELLKEAADAVVAKVLAKLSKAQSERAESDGKAWRSQIVASCNQIASAAESQDKGRSWMNVNDGVYDRMVLALETLGLVKSAAPEPFRTALAQFYNAAPDTLLDAWDVADTNVRGTAIPAIKVFLREFAAQTEVLLGTENKMLNAESLHGLKAALGKLATAVPQIAAEATVDSLGSDVVMAEESRGGKGDTLATPTLTAVLPSGKSVLSLDVLPSVNAPFLQTAKELPDATGDDTVRAARVLAELESGFGNSFTVALSMGPDGKISQAGLRGRTPSPFKGTMGAHATAWVVWVHAVRNLVEGVTTQQAGDNLAKFAQGLVANAAGQNPVVGGGQSAQNGQRRDNARWTPGSLAAWSETLKDLQQEAWTVSGVQAYAQAVLTFVNMVPGTTRAEKSTSGHGEAAAFQRAQAAFKASNLGAAFRGQGLFDARADWLRPRHFALMELALQGTKSEVWKKWPELK